MNIKKNRHVRSSPGYVGYQFEEKLLLKQSKSKFGSCWFIKIEIQQKYVSVANNGSLRLGVGCMGQAFDFRIKSKGCHSGIFLFLLMSFVFVKFDVFVVCLLFLWPAEWVSNYKYYGRWLVVQSSHLHSQNGWPGLSSSLDTSFHPWSIEVISAWRCYFIHCVIL